MFRKTFAEGEHYFFKKQQRDIKSLVPIFKKNEQLWLFRPEFAQKWVLVSEFQKSKSGFRISILEIQCVPIFRQNEQLWIFWPKFAQKWISGSEFQKSNSGFGINTSTLSCVPIFSQNWQHLFFNLNLGKLPNYMHYFGSNIVESVAESWVEVEMSWGEVELSWVEVGARFSNTRHQKWEQFHQQTSSVEEKYFQKLSL